MMLNLALTVHQFDNDIKSQTTHDNMSEVAGIGYWQSHYPIGFVGQKVSVGEVTSDGHQKKRTILVPDNRENRAETIAYLFNRMAIGDLKEMQLYNIAVKMGLRMPDKNHRIISFATFDRMLRNPIYAGWYNSKNLLNKKMTKMKFDGLVDLETWQKVQYILDGEKRVFTMSDDDSYPLKGTLICECCAEDGKDGKKLLASAPISGGGKPSPRYHCRAKGHSSIGKNEMHEMFVSLLEQITPKESTIKLFKEIIKRTAKKKLLDTNKMLNDLGEKEKKINDGIAQALEAFLETHQIDEEEKQIRIDSLKKQRVELQKQRVELEKVQQLNETTIEYVCNFIGQPAKLWKDADLETKRAFQQMLFPNGLHVDLPNRCFKNCGTDDLSPLYSVMNTKNGSNDPSDSRLVISARVELALTG
ncbi:recombinase family protein [Candidatus Saccharibacteria bacterium]|nr:recombinase family protein [Candidatus Saccharibacteria bacterium]